jgi:hypothetical protein
VAKVRAAGARLLGPNCMGATDAGAELFVASSPGETGPVGLISQSGNLGIELGLLLGREGLGFSRFVSLGNQADIEAVEVLESLVDHPRRGRSCSTWRASPMAAASSRRRGAPTPSASPSSSSRPAPAPPPPALPGPTPAPGLRRRRLGGRLLGPAASSRLPARGRPSPPSRPCCRRSGRAVLASASSPTVGGHGVIAADLATAAGLAVPPLSPATAHALAAGLPPTASTANPVDLAGGGEQDFSSYAGWSVGCSARAKSTPCC